MVIALCLSHHHKHLWQETLSCVNTLTKHTALFHSPNQQSPWYKYLSHPVTISKNATEAEILDAMTAWNRSTVVLFNAFTSCSTESLTYSFSHITTKPNYVSQYTVAPFSFPSYLNNSYISALSSKHYKSDQCMDTFLSWNLSVWDF